MIGRLRGRLGLRRRAAARAAPLAVRAARRAGFDLVPRSYYSPIPDLATIPPEVWTRRSPLRGIDLDPERAFAFAEGHLAAYVREFDPPMTGSWDQPRFFLLNGGFQDVDADLTYAMIRHLCPARVVELGSGFSTLVMAEALRRNAAAGHPAELLSHDPYPRPHVAGHAIPGLTALRHTPAQDVPDETFAALGDGDVLFVDTTHTVRLGGDVNRVVLDVLPALAPGVLVHFHDIWLPWEYHRGLVEHVPAYWAEQYLLQAFLSGRDDYEVVLPIQALVRHDPERMRALVPRYDTEHHPSGFWLRRLR